MLTVVNDAGYQLATASPKQARYRLNLPNGYCVPGAKTLKNPDLTEKLDAGPCAALLWQYAFTAPILGIRSARYLLHLPKAVIAAKNGNCCQYAIIDAVRLNMKPHPLTLALPGGEGKK